MSEEDYQLCRDIRQLQAAALAIRPMSERRSRLVVHACTRPLAHLLTRPAVRQAIDTAYQYADGLATEQELLEARCAVREAASKAPRQSKWDEALRVVLYATTSPDHFSVGYNLPQVVECVCRAIDLDRRSGTTACLDSEFYRGEMSRCCDWFRDLHPYHGPRSLPTSPPWIGEDVSHVARVIYDEARFEDMPVLADALEDASCDAPELIAHCRQQGSHIRGCWAVDLLLGRK